MIYPPIYSSSHYILWENRVGVRVGSPLHRLVNEMDFYVVHYLTGSQEGVGISSPKGKKFKEGTVNTRQTTLLHFFWANGVLSKCTKLIKKSL